MFESDTHAILTVQEIAIVDFVKELVGSEDRLMEKMRIIYNDSNESYALFVSHEGRVKELIATGFGTVLWPNETLGFDGITTETLMIHVDVLHTYKTLKASTNKKLYKYVRNKINYKYKHIIQMLFCNTLKLDATLESDSPTSEGSHHVIRTPDTEMTETNHYQKEMIMDSNLVTANNKAIKDYLLQTLPTNIVSEVELDNVIAMIRAEVLSEVTKKLDFSTALTMDVSTATATTNSAPSATVVITTATVAATNTEAAPATATAVIKNASAATATATATATAALNSATATASTITDATTATTTITPTPTIPDATTATSSTAPAAASSSTPAAASSTAPAAASSTSPAAASSSTPAAASASPAAASSTAPAATSSTIPAATFSSTPAASSSTTPAATSSTAPTDTSSTARKGARQKAAAGPRASRTPVQKAYDYRLNAFSNSRKKEYAYIYLCHSPMGFHVKFGRSHGSTKLHSNRYSIMGKL